MKKVRRNNFPALFVSSLLAVLVFAFSFMLSVGELSPIRVVADFKNASPAFNDFSFRFQSGFLDWWKREGKFELQFSSTLILRIMEEGAFFVCYLEEAGQERKTLAKLPIPTAPGEVAFVVEIAMERIVDALRSLDMISNSVYQRLAIFSDHLRFFMQSSRKDGVRGKWRFAGKPFVSGGRLFMRTEASRLEGRGKVYVESEIPEEESEIPPVAQKAAGELRREMSLFFMKEAEVVLSPSASYFFCGVFALK
ncbi:MAG: hypothetical protein Q8R12_01180 [bacterium]|nr:hypothetical protein [bacterium]